MGLRASAQPISTSEAASTRATAAVDGAASAAPGRGRPVRIREVFERSVDYLQADRELVTVCGWVRTVRDQKRFAFVQVNDGTNVAGLQVVVEADVPAFALVPQLSTGCSVTVRGRIRESPAKGQPIEMVAAELTLTGSVDADYPLQKKRHSFEFLRTVAHLRARTNSFAAVARVRSALAFATHEFFHQRGFYYLHSPIVTASDCEGAGEMFRVTTLEPGKADVRDEDDFFGKRASLTVSGQLSAEAYACALSKVYTFGPTFRAENSNTTRHLAEFWMIEPEMAFADRDDAMDNAEAYVRHCIEQMLRRQNEELELFDRFVEKGLKRKLQATLERPFARITYTEAIAVLQASGESFEFAPHWGADLQTEHERFLAEKHFQRPVFVYDYPAAIKAFYMRLNDVDGGDGGDGREPARRTVAAFDLLVPGLGELVGGSQREERLDTLLQRMRECNLDPATYWWYLDLRRYGTVPHAGYGLGFERLVQYCTGMDNIRDVIPFARYPGHCEF